MPTELIRRNISGIYIFDKFPSDERHRPTCVEDCQVIGHIEEDNSTSESTAKNIAPTR